MRPKDLEYANLLGRKLTEFHQNIRPLPGVTHPTNLQSLVEQIIESRRRIKYVSKIMSQPLSQSRKDPLSPLYDPIRAAHLHHLEGNFDEACWQVFLFTHFGKSASTGWRLLRDIYGCLGQDDPWTWEITSQNPDAFSEWLARNYGTLRSDGVMRKFGNHRKYETLRSVRNGTASVISSYVSWVGPERSHKAKFDIHYKNCESDPQRTFRSLYKSMDAVRRFGRTAKFDYLSMLGKLSLLDIRADAAYLSEATGPLHGARLLFGGAKNSLLDAHELERSLALLDQHLEIGMQTIEDSLCNWQKSPGKFIAFRG